MPSTPSRMSLAYSRFELAVQANTPRPFSRASFIKTWVTKSFRGKRESAPAFRALAAGHSRRLEKRMPFSDRSGHFRQILMRERNHKTPGGQPEPINHRRNGPRHLPSPGRGSLGFELHDKTQ